jgi:hypothetical protein
MEMVGFLSKQIIHAHSSVDQQRYISLPWQCRNIPDYQCFDPAASLDDEPP